MKGTTPLFEKRFQSNIKASAMLLEICFSEEIDATPLILQLSPQALQRQNSVYL